MAPSALETAAMRRRVRAWQALTLALLFAGYAGYYLCRSHLSVAAPLLTADLVARGMPPQEARIHIGQMVSLGVLAYAVGKLLLAGFADLFGGRGNFLVGMAGAIVFTLLFAAGGGLPLLTAAWIGNRFVQAGGWAGLVKVASRWFSHSSHGTVMAILSLSFLFGDALARQYMGALIGLGLGWRGVFWAAGLTLVPILLLSLWLLRESRTEIGAPPAEVSPDNLFADDAPAADDRPKSFAELLRPFLRSPAFWVVCFLSLIATLMRETFNQWTPTYFYEVAGYSQARAAELSAVFPFFGGLSVLLTGVTSDRFGARGRAAIMALGFLVAAGALAAMAMPRTPGAAGAAAVWQVSVAAFGLIGPYSYLAGAIALDFGGARGGAIASGLIDSVGYLGAILAGDSVARVSTTQGWSFAFAILAGLLVLASAAAASLLLRRR